ncbi:hypothetical protein PSN45_000288 [Yamadazyma tenuis]|uniref:glutathione-specific gamma-glutamylcyclotransferase n=1 Tax=Candida tenuis (strain ATCC 10573 / BCRC 21748 / CBS 615 / JCM 9827 / NBRC 10315 / NRRL Y-1498 / VKM Y-70) TaxID=590646 RepID=G3B7A5_CANTC|nr:ChaC-like protein [Yamadazyma tenuis ATCC 10573]EGV62579.1 ChaC-like protein [Yamadazyma tenuis ATCC 10573]WEJ92830.1 hypothetical protein PSN45_000288 [Yamadazyma tenuis]
MAQSENGMWIIGYGSLIFKPPPFYSFRVNGYIEGFIRRFWQSSSDHRGTPESPGRVVTLVSLEDLLVHDKLHHDIHVYELLEHKAIVSVGASVAQSSVSISSVSKADLKVWGCAYYIAPENVEKVKEYLDVREQDGYTTHVVPFVISSISEENEFTDEVISHIPKENGVSYITSSIYIGTVENASFIGPEDVKVTAKKIVESRGPSGENLEYLQKLCESVRGLGAADQYLEELYKLASLYRN